MTTLAADSPLPDPAIFSGCLYSAAPWGHLTGAPICALEHLLALKSHFREVRLVLCEHGPLEDRACAAGIATTCLPFEFRGLRQAGPWKFVRNIAFVMRSRWRYVRSLRRMLLERPGILHVHSRAAHLPYALLAGRWAGVPMVVTLHEPWKDGFEARTEVWLIRRWADQVVFLSQEMRRQYRPYLRDRGAVVYNYLKPAPVGADSRRDPPVIALPARLGHRKGVDVFLEACRILRDSGIRFEPWLVGEWNSDEERRQAYEYTRAHGLETLVRDRGLATDMVPVYAAMDILVLTSRRDPLPRVVMEAMGQGIPVVATRVDGIPEMVEDGTTGYLVESEDAEGVARKLAQLLADGERRRKMGEAGRKRALGLFSPETYVARMLNLYREIAGAS